MRIATAGKAAAEADKTSAQVLSASANLAWLSESLHSDIEGNPANVRAA
ncbi:MAG: hypothetical protein ACREGL_05305 [Alphaproteobacteria bacterium]